MVEISTILKGAPVSAQKARLVVNEIRGMKVSNALDFLAHCPKKAAEIIKKVLNSAIANAKNNNGLEVGTLQISEAYVDEGGMLKRMHFRARGRTCRILKRRCHITIRVAANSEEQ